ncbi:hypothetical protein BC829DRAFT_161962 [Chytridium lagenaria]|nr:hypothetical protein BC829DRAFT_161962 [Chytridium lagenaria]
MNYGRPPTGSLANRPSSRMSSQGGPNGWNKAPAAGPQTAVPPRTGIMGGTSRGQNMAGARPVTGSIRGIMNETLESLNLFLSCRSTHDSTRLGGMRTSNLGTGRVVQDITYFQSELRQKINLLNGEIGKLNSECDTVEKENSNYNAFEKRADSLAQELRELQGQLGI